MSTNAAEWLSALRWYGGFRYLPFLDSGGQHAGIHLHRFTPGGIEVVQAWNETYAVAALLPNTPDANDPFTLAPGQVMALGTFAEVAAKLLGYDSDPETEGDHGRHGRT